MNVKEGLNLILDTVYDSVYIGLKAAGTISTNDTLSSHSGWNEITAYSGNRQTLEVGSASNKIISGTATFSITSNCTIAGLLIATVASGSSGVLLNVKDFDTPVIIEAGDDFEVTYRIQASAG